VTERSPAAWVRRAPDVVALVDVRGRVLTDVAEAPAELPELSGLTAIPPPGGETAPRAAVGVLGKLPAELHGRVAHVTAGRGAGGRSGWRCAPGRGCAADRPPPSQPRRAPRWPCPARSRARRPPTSTCASRRRRSPVEVESVGSRIPPCLSVTAEPRVEH